MKDIKALKASPGVVIRSDLGVRILYFTFNCAVEPFENPKVRQALSYAVPYDTLVEDVMYGQVQQLKSPIPSGMPGHNGSASNYSYDLDGPGSCWPTRATRTGSSSSSRSVRASTTESRTRSLSRRRWPRSA